MLSLTHPTIDLYLCLTHAQLSSRCVCVALFAPTDITFSEWADESCIIIIAVEERTCALPGIVFNSKPRLIFNPCIIVDGALQRSNVYVVDGVVRSLSIFRFRTTYTDTDLTHRRIHFTYNTYSSSVLMCVWADIDRPRCLHCRVLSHGFQPKTNTTKNGFALRGRVLSGCDKPQQIWCSRPFREYNSQK